MLWKLSVKAEALGMYQTCFKVEFLLGYCVALVYSLFLMFWDNISITSSNVGLSMYHDLTHLVYNYYCEVKRWSDFIHFWFTKFTSTEFMSSACPCLQCNK